MEIAPARCIDSKTNFDDGCSYSCKRGYTSTSGNQARKCQADGTWSGQELVCEGIFMIKDIMYFCAGLKTCSYIFVH